MLHRFALVFALWLTTGPAPGAPVTGAKSKKEAATEEKKKAAAADSHTVKRGETIWGIARLHGVSVGDIMDLNRLTDSTLRDGQVLKIPSLGSDPALAPTTATTHTVAKGETFRSIARKYGLTQEDIERANPKTNPAAPQAGSKLTIPATVSVAEKTSSDADTSKPPETIHTVTENDTYDTIAKKYGITEGAIGDANPGVNPNRLRPGSKLNIPQRPTSARKDDEDAAPGAGNAPLVTATAGKTGAVPEKTHTVTENDTYDTIAKKYGITEGAIGDANPGVNPNRLRPGSKLNIPQRPTSTRKDDEDAAPAVASAPLVTATAGKTGAVPETTHTVTESDTYDTIAKKYGITERAIADANPGVNPNRLRPGSKLNIPQRPTSARKDVEDAAPAAGNAPLVTATARKTGAVPETNHTVTESDTYDTIAKKYGITERAIADANPGVNPNRLRPGSKLNIPQRPTSTRKDVEDAAPAAGNAALVTATARTKTPEKTHFVTENDTYSVIAKKYGITEGAITAANPDVNPNRLRPGSKLNIPQLPTSARKEAARAAGNGPLITATARKNGAVPDDPPGNAKSPTDGKPKPKTRRYVVSDDETAQTISEAFNISVGKLYEINGLKPGSAVKTGMEIQVPSLPGGRSE